MRREDELRRAPIQPAQSEPHLRHVAVAIADAIRAEVLRHFAEEQVPLGGAACTRHTRCGVDDDCLPVIDQAVLHQRRQAEHHARRVAPGVRHQAGAAQLLTPKLGKAVRRAVLAGPQIR